MSTDHALTVDDVARDLAPEIAALPRLSRVVECFLAQAGRDTAGAEDIAVALDLDPVLRGWVLRQANSGFCKLTRPVTSVAQACVVIGIGPLTRLVYAACTRDLLQHRLACYRYPGHGFWLHGLAAASAAGLLAERTGDAAGLGTEEARVAGLVHDVGKLLLDDRLPRAGGPRQVSVAEELAVTGIDHARVSAAVAASWQLPPAVVAAVAGHHLHDPEPGARCLALADTLVRHWGLGPWTYARLDLDPPWRTLTEQARPLGLRHDDLAAWCDELRPILAGLEEMLRAIGSGVPPALPAGAPDTPPTPTTRSRRDRRRPSQRRQSARKPRRR